jgi:hypothetical protein
MNGFEAQVFDLIRTGIAVELLAGVDADGTAQVGVRLRTFGKNLPKDKMVLSGGETIEEALEEACGKAANERWERLDWAARPWEPADYKGAQRYGFAL